MSAFSSRLRTPPSSRFRGDERCFDLDKAFDQLPRESVLRDGHIQKTLYRYGPTTIAIFAFVAGAKLDEYRVEGEAILHLLAGRMIVRTASEEYDLRQGSLLLLDPKVSHSLAAVEQSRLLLTVVLNEHES